MTTDTHGPARAGTEFREIAELQRQINDLVESRDRLNEETAQNVRDLSASVNTALDVIKKAAAEILADVPERLHRLEQIIEPLRLTADDVASGIEVRVRETDGRWRPIAAADIANAILAGKRVVKLVPRVIE